MIITPGRVIVTKDQIEVTQFAFKDCDLRSAEIEALVWARNRLNQALRRSRKLLAEYLG